MISKILIGILIPVSIACYFLFNENTLLKENAIKLESAVLLNEEALESLQADFAASQVELENINKEYASIRRQNKQLADKLQQIDLTAAAQSNPEGIEKAVNRGTENSARCFELLSGAELTEKERSATDGITFNKECPWLWPGVSTDSVQQPD